MTTENLIIGARLRRKVSGEIVKVTNVGKGVICAEDGTSSWHDINDYEPVELSNDLLESLGWEATEAGILRQEYPEIMITQTGNEGYLIEKDFGEGDWNKVALVDYFHELQVAMKVQGYTI